jgi:hypothetical protein
MSSRNAELPHGARIAHFESIPAPPLGEDT